VPDNDYVLTEVKKAMQTAERAAKLAKNKAEQEAKKAKQKMEQVQ